MAPSPREASAELGDPETAEIALPAPATSLPLASERREPPHAEAITAAAPPAPSASQSLVNEAVTRRAFEEVRLGFELADRRAYFSARNAFCQALRLVAEELDATVGETGHGRALAAAMRAIDESDEFVTEGALPDADVHVATIASAHRTPVLRDAHDQVTPVQARRQYYTYAQEQFALAVGNEPAGAAALFGLGKLHTLLTEVRPTVVAAAPSKALVYYQAALLVNPSHAAAANELGVALAREGRYADARPWLIHSALLAPGQETWHNLAAVHERLGETDLAARARQEVRLAGRQAPRASASRVEWVDTARFAARGEAAAPASASAATRGAAPSEPKRGLSRWLPWK